MGRIRIVDGDLFDATEKYLCHQCNCVTSRAAHLSKAVFDRFPYANVYRGRKVHDVPGSIEVRGNGLDQRFVANLFGQYYPGFSKYPNSNLDGYEARFRYFRECLRRLGKLGGDFAFPWRIGCGAAGGKWVRYLEELMRFAKDVDGVSVYRLPGAV